MTFKSTSLSVERLRLAGLVELAPRLFTGEKKRSIYVSEEIRNLIVGAIDSNPEFPCAQADFEIGKFVRGNIIGVSRKHSSKAELKWLMNVPESWVYCFRTPPPGWRLFGRFVRKNIFVGLNCAPRELCGDPVGYAKQASIATERWDALFPNELPFLAKDFESYLGEMVIER